MTKLGLYSMALTGVLLMAAQFVRPTMKDPPHEALLQGAVVPSNVQHVFERACQDCHSNNTQWPWYSKVTPVSFLVAKDVNRGRQFLNLSEWQKYSRGQKIGYLSSMALAARNQKMPPKVYTVMHSDARLTDAERDSISVWAHQELQRMRSR